MPRRLGGTECLEAAVNDLKSEVGVRESEANYEV